MITGIAFITSLLLCGGLSDELIPFQGLVTNVLTQNPLVTLGTQTSANVLANTVDTFTQLPFAIARVLGSDYSLPVLLNRNNVVDFTDTIVLEFNSNRNNEDAHLSIVELISKYGYPVEVHTVQTEDGYILNMHRIPNNGSVVFLMHGLLGSADDFVIAGPDDGLAYLLADEGYDVWMGNARGNKHSRRHIAYSPSESKFWQFTWHEIGFYDLPAMIDHALMMSDSDRLEYIGHSQGTTAFFVMGSERPQYNNKISLMIALSPVAYMTHVKSPIIRLLAPGGPLIHGLTKTLGVYEFLPNNSLMRTLKWWMCGGGSLSEIMCNNILFLVAGFDLDQLNVTNLPVLFGHEPAGASTKQLAHYAQSVMSGEFRQYDYGSVGNIEYYGSPTPPRYPLERVSAPVSLFYSDADWLAQPADVDKLYNELGNAVDIHKVPFENFNHLDFLFAKDFKSFIYARLRKLLLLF